MTPDEISTILRIIKNENTSSLENGLKTREEIRQKILAGETPDHYRVDWLRETALAAIGFIADTAHAFEAKYPNDKISQNDLLDVLINAANMIVKHSGAGTLIVKVKPND